MPDNYQPPSRQAVRWVERSHGSGAHLLHSGRLSGGLTADMDRLTIRSRSGRAFDVVLRRWPRSETWASGLVERESAGLTEIADHGLPAPRLLAADPTGEHAGTPSLLMTAMPGEPLLMPPDQHDFVRQLAAMLARIHEIPAPNLDPTDPHGYEPDADRNWLDNPALAQTLVQAASAARPDDAATTLIHGDYHPLNVLWHDHRISGIVDWTYTGRGPRATDVGHCRLTLAVLFSVEIAEDFLRCYETETGQPIDPRQDIRSLLAYNSDWLGYARRAVAGRAHVDEPGMAHRVTDLLKTAALRLG